MQLDRESKSYLRKIYKNLFFVEKQIQKIEKVNFFWQNFWKILKKNCNKKSREDLLAIPEFAVNPLAERIGLDFKKKEKKNKFKKSN